jgi:HEAT repeats
MALFSAVPGTRGSNGPSEKNFLATLKALINSLGDRHKSVRAAATRALWMVALVASVPEGLIDIEPATSALIELLDVSDPAIRFEAIRGLGAVGPTVLGDPPARLVAAIEDQSDKSRDAAVEASAVFHHGFPRLIPSFVKSAERARPQARAGYLKLLSRIKRPKFTGRERARPDHSSRHQGWGNCGRSTILS